MGKFNNNSEKVVSWPEKDFNSLMFCAVDDFDKLESIRTHFAPGHLLNRGMSINLRNKPPASEPSPISQQLSPGTSVEHHRWQLVIAILRLFNRSLHPAG